MRLPTLRRALIRLGSDLELPSTTTGLCPFVRSKSYPSMPQNNLLNWPNESTAGVPFVAFPCGVWHQVSAALLDLMLPDSMEGVLAPLARHDELLSVSGSRGPVFRRYLLNGQIDQDDTWPQEVQVCDLIFHHVLL